MLNFFIDLILLAVFVIGITAFLGIITHGVASKLFGRNSYLRFNSQSAQTRNGWRKL